MKKNSTHLLVLFLLLCTTKVYSQNPWNANTFKLTADIAALEDMTGATAVSFPGSGVRTTDTLSFPAGFRFRYGLDTVKQFSLSTYGWIKLGARNRSNSFINEDSIITIFSNAFSAFACSYKMVGTTPYRRMVVEWSGVFSGNGQQVKFQLWLHETNGRIAMVHQGVSNIFSGSYYILCKTRILGQQAFAAVDVLTPLQAPLVNYSNTVANAETIPTNTRYTFQPDTVKPIQPGISFANVLPGCFTVNIKDSSTNETAFSLEKRLTGNNYFLSKRSFTTSTATTGTLYVHNETNAKPDSLYTFRAYATNGFVNSDTTVANLLTPSPLINGTKTIPGDYASINALLQDAVCKHIGPNLVIELQPNYSFAAEGGVVRFKPVLVHRNLQSITIRPAASATALTVSNTAAYPLIMVDSVPFVHIDGRAGGTGTANNLTISQGDQYQPAIAFVNNASGGGVHYTNITGRTKASSVGLLFLGARDPLNFGVNYANAANNTTINNCKIGPASGFTLKGILVEGGDNNTIRNNEFFRFLFDAINYIGGGRNSRIVGNRLYQPEPVPAQYDFVSNNSPGAMVFTNVKNNFMVDSNRLGGSSATWGVGSWRQDISYSGTISGYALIHITQSTAVEPGSLVYIRHNLTGNLNITGNNFLHQTYIKGGRTIIANNQFGTADSLGSIVNDYHLLGLISITATHVTIANNFMGGFRGNRDGSLIWSSFVDSLFINNNNIGGSSQYNANSFAERASGIEFNGNHYAVIKNNVVQGISSSNLSALGIVKEWNEYTSINGYAILDSNKVHHLSGRRTLLGIYLRLGSEKNNQVSGNEVYALRGYGPSNFTGADNPTTMTAIAVSARESSFNVPSKDTGIVYMQNNKIYALEYSTPSRTYTYPVGGIGAEGLRFRISNNMISLGTNAAGNATDSIEMACTGIGINSAKMAEVEHNSIYIGGASESLNYGISLTGANNYTNGKKDYFLTNNIIQIDRRPSALSDVKYYVSAINYPTNNIVANKNIWYSNDDPDINAKRQQWVANCQCDSLGFVANPMFTNPFGDSSNTNLHLQAINPADSAGTPSIAPILTDFDNDLRNNYSPADIGADAVTPCAGGNASISLSPYQDKIEICTGSSLTLTATVNGVVTNWQWQKNLNNIPGAIALSYTITSPGSYRLIGRTACGWIASPSILIQEGITEPYKKLTALTAGPYCDSTNVAMWIEHNHFSLTTLQYKWYRNNVLLPGKITDKETIEGIRYGDNVYVEIINPTPCGNTQVSDNLYFYDVNPSQRPKANIVSLKDTLYTLNANDTVKYNISPSGFGLPTVIYTSTVPAPLHSFIGDSMIVFSNIPYTFSFKLSIGNPAIACQFADTTQQKTIYVTNSTVPKTYTFNGTGNWSNPANWSNGEVPPSPLPFNGTILINSGTCTLNQPFTIGIGGQLTVAAGANLIVQGNLIRL